jgi:Tol biopolymer transport system component
VTLRRIALGVALLLTAAVACLNDTLAPAGTELRVVLNASVAGVTQASRVHVAVSYQRSGAAPIGLPVSREDINVTPGQAPQTVELTVDLTRCLGDETARIQGQPGCLLQVELQLFNEANTLLDVQTQSLEQPVLPNGPPVELPEFSLAPPLLTIDGGGPGTGSGTVTAAAAGGQSPLSCTITDGTPAPTGCSQRYPHGTAVTVVAPGGELSGGCSGTETCSLILDRSQEVKASFAPSPTVGGLQVNVSGLPAGVPADVDVNAPTGFSQHLNGSQILSGLAPGDYTVTARNVIAGDLTYTPDPASQTLAVFAGQTAVVNVAYNGPTTGSLIVTISGLPPGSSASVTVSGPNGFQQPVLETATLSELAPGDYSVSAQPVSAGGTDYSPVPVTQPVSILPGRSASANVLYSPPPATQLIFVQEPPAAAEAGAVLAPAISVAAQDAQGRTVSTYSTPISLALGPNSSAATLAGGGAASPVNGVARFPSVSINRLGTNFSLIATSGSLPPKSSRAFAITASRALSTVSADPDTIRAGTGAARITVTAKDVNGNPLAGGTVALLLNPAGSGALAQPGGPTDGSGQAVGSLSSAAPGTVSVSANINGVSIVQTATVVVVPAVVFAGDPTGKTSLGVYVANPDGSAYGPVVADLVGDEVAPRWSPDRRRIAFTARPFGSPLQLRLSTATGDTSAVLVSDTSSRRPRFSPDGRHLAFECGSGNEFDSDVCVIPDVTRAVISLTTIGNGPGKSIVTDAVSRELSGSGAFVWDPSNPDLLAVVRDVPLGDPEFPTLASQIFLVSFDGRRAQRLSDPLIVRDISGSTFLRVVRMDWAPDGSYLALSAEESPGFQKKIYRINRDGSGLQRLTSPSAEAPVEDLQPSVSPDSRSVLFLRSGVAFEGSVEDYVVVDAFTGAERQLTGEAGIPATNDELSADWSPGGARIVLVGTTSFGLGIYVVPSTTTSQTYATDRVLISSEVAKHIQPSWRP